MIRYRILNNFPAYRVGTDGSVWSRWKRIKGGWLIDKQWTQLKPSYNVDGYWTICLRNSSGKKWAIRIASLVLRTFRGPPPFYRAHARHLNGNTKDNRLRNLKWGTAKQNMEDQYRHGTRAYGEKIKSTKFKDKDIINIRKRLANGESQSSVAIDMKCSQSTISRIYLRQVWNHI